MDNIFEDSKNKEVIKDMGKGAALGGSLGAVAGGLKNINQSNKKMAKWVQTGSKKAGYQVKSKLGKNLGHFGKSMLKSGAKGAAIGAGVIGAAHLGKKAYDHFKNKNESLTERLDRHLQSIKESNEIDGKKIKNDILKANPPHNIPDKEFKLLVLAILEPTLKANSIKFIKPNFNSFKNLLVKDIKYAIKAMTSETSWGDAMSKEEAIDMLFHNSEGDGAYVDTTFGEPYSILIDYVPELERYQDSVEEYLCDIIDQNEKSLISAVK